VIRTAGQIDSLETVRILADPRRLEILRLLMAAPATLTQLGRRLRHSAAWVQHHVRALEDAGLVQFHESRVRGRATEKYYRAASGAFIIEKLIVPKARQPVVIFSGSHDPALDGVVRSLETRRHFVTLFVGSLNGLTSLRQGQCHLSGIHLMDASGEYNVPYVRHFFADREVELVTLAHRTQGLMVRPGNRKHIRRLEDLRRSDVRFVNRNAGSGTRLWLDAALQQTAIAPESIRGYRDTLATHTQAAEWIEAARADVTLGLQAAAHEMGLDFVPLFQERYDLVVPRETERMLAPVLDYIQTVAFRQRAGAMTGYDTAHSGELIPISKGI